MSPNNFVAQLLNIGLPPESLNRVNKTKHMTVLKAMNTQVKLDPLVLATVAEETLEICRTSATNMTFLVAEFIADWMIQFGQPGLQQSDRICKCLYSDDGARAYQYNHAISVLEGHGCKKDPPESVRILSNLLGEETDKTMLRGFTLTALSKAYLDGVGVVASQHTAVTMLKEAADIGVIDAVYSMGLYYAGKLFPIGDDVKDPNMAAMFYSKASSAGFIPAQTNLGILHLYQTIDRADPTYGEKLLRIAADAGDREALFALVVYGNMESTDSQTTLDIFRTNEKPL